MTRLAVTAILFVDLAVLLLSMRTAEEVIPATPRPGSRTPWMLRNIQCAVDLPEGFVVIDAASVRLRTQEAGFFRIGALKVLELSPFEASLFPHGAASPRTRLRSEIALMNLATKEVTFSGQVSIQDDSGRLFSFRRLEWREDSRQLVSPGSAWISDAGGRRRVRGFSASLDLTELRYKTSSKQ